MNDEDKKEVEEKTTEEAQPGEAKEESKPTDATKETEPQKTPEASGTEDKPTDEDKPWKNEKNARYAQLRRDNEELKKRLDALQSERRENITEQALKDLGLTREDLSDDDNMLVATEYTKALAKGEQDPIAYAYRTVYRKSMEAKRKASEETAKEAKAKEETAKKVKADTENFKAAYPNVNINDLVKDGSEFNDLFGDVPDIIGNVTKYFGKYLKMKGMASTQPKKATEADKAKGQPYVGGNNTNSQGGERLTKAQAMALPQKEFDAYIAKLKSAKH